MSRSFVLSTLLLAFFCVAGLLASATPLSAGATWGPNYFPALPDDALFSTVYWRQDSNNYKSINFGYAIPSTKSVAVAKVATTTQLKDGWHALYVKVEEDVMASAATNPLLMNATYYAAGYAEGYATSQLIYYSYYNQMVAETIANLSTEAMDWVNTHIAYMRKTSSDKGAGDAYWAQVGKILLQIEGMTDGYNAQQNLTPNPKPLTFLDIFMISFIDETADVERSAYILNGKEIPQNLKDRLKRVGEHCSALIKLVPNDVFISHATWNSLGGLLKTFKTYQFGSTVLQVSSYPGNVASDDDYYYINNGLVAQETTNHNHNNSNTIGTQPYSVSEFIRALVSSYLSGGDPNTWTETFCKDNSGTYNNQYMVLQLQGFIPASKTSAAQMTAGSFSVAEQMPGLCINRDQTAHLNTYSYWSSYNRPFYPEIFAGMNWTNMEKLSSYYSYGNNYRANIFRREQANVQTLADMRTLMRYNDYKNDVESIVPDCPECWPQHTPYLSIAARCDLVPANGTFGVLDGEISLQDEAALDAKITSLNLLRGSKMLSSIAMGPPFDGPSQLPAFTFSTTKVTPRPRNMGLPDTIKYNYTSSNDLFSNAPEPTPDFTRVRGVMVVFSALVDASTFVRANFNTVFRGFLMNTLGYTDPTGQTTVNINGAYWYNVSIQANFIIAGPEKANWENQLAREPLSRLLAGNVAGVSFAFANFPQGPEAQSNLWIIGVVIASLMGVLIVILLFTHLNKLKGATYEEERDSMVIGGQTPYNGQKD